MPKQRSRSQEREKKKRQRVRFNDAQKEKARIKDKIRKREVRNVETAPKNQVSNLKMTRENFLDAIKNKSSLTIESNVSLNTSTSLLS